MKIKIQIGFNVEAAEERKRKTIKHMAECTGGGDGSKDLKI